MMLFNCRCAAAAAGAPAAWAGRPSAAAGADAALLRMLLNVVTHPANSK